MSTILVTGGTGVLGREVVRRLSDGGADVRVFSRRPRPSRAQASVTWCVGDLATGDGLATALRGADAVVHCATSGGRRDVGATQRLALAARRAGSPHLLYVSIVGVERTPSIPYYSAKLACERAVRRSGLPWTVLRATQFHSLVAAVVRAQRRSPVVLTAGGGVRLQPVDAGEVGSRLAELAVGSPAGQAADMAGPEIRTMLELTHEVLAADGLRRTVLPLRLPGKAFRALRGGALLAPRRAVGRVTFEDYLARAATGAGQDGP
ncbi:SDR family oxidoreductase [Streptomyces avicenniae]|uniref:SDR family oxidoreductase n=1 Tax=Streptomyces avicenniae TaxID=500153 RepID=UPI00069AEABD|nr:NAD(P)H-binding protein [Streptomyces avicenniae]